MQKIVPHLWFDKEAMEAANLYLAAFGAGGGSAIEGVTRFDGTPSGEVSIINLRLSGFEMILMNAGPYFRFNPSVSFLVSCGSAEDVDRIVGLLGKGGSALMPLDAYPFSGRYAWITDRFGLSWQVMLMDRPEMASKLGQDGTPVITPTQMFAGAVCGKAEEALRLYVSLFPESTVDGMMRYGEGEAPDAAGTVKHAGFRLAGQAFAAMDSAYDHGFGFNEAVSYLVRCKDQAEVDRYWSALSAVPESEQCGWLKDRFGFSWQIVPVEMDALMATPDAAARDRAVKAMLGMKKLDMDALRRAAAGA